MRWNFRPARGTTLAPWLIFVASVFSPVSASVVYVDPNAAGPAHDGASWSTAFTAIQPAINAASSGDEVWVAASAPAAPAYFETIGLKAGVALYGGFAGTENARAARDRTANQTLLDAGANPNAKLVTSAVEGAVLDGFTFRHANFAVAVDGGSIAIANCAVEQCFYGFATTGITSVATIAVSNCTFKDGGYAGLDVGDRGSMTASNCTFSANQVGVHASGILAVTNCTLSGNTIGVHDISSGTVAITNCTISGNACGVRSYHVDDGSARATTIANSIVAFNGKGIDRVTPQYAIALSHNDVYGNTTADYVLIPAPTGVNGNLSQDPHLSNRFHDIRLQPDSPCINAGDDAAVTAGWTDIDGQPRISGEHVDIGSDESDGTTWNVPTRRWHVSPSGDDGNDGLTWASAKRTVASALAASRGPDEVWVAKGAYAGYVVVPAGVSLYGGFAGTESAREQRTSTGSGTTLSGDAAHAAVQLREGTRLDGFTVRGENSGVFVNECRATIANCTIGSAAKWGVGVEEWGGPTTLNNCTITGNGFAGIQSGGDLTTVADCTISANGRGVSLVGGETVMTGCDVAGNESGIYVDNGGATVSRCTIRENSYGVYPYGGEATVTDCTMSGNGTAVYSFTHAVDIRNCTLTGNASGVYVMSGATTVANCVVAFNGTGILRNPDPFVTPTPTVLLSHNDVYSSTGVDYSGVSGPGDGSISEDPLFVNRIGGDFHLLPASPCIDAGADKAVTDGETDRDGRPRIAGVHVDIGAFEAGTVPPSFTVADVVHAVRVAGGLEVVPVRNAARLDVEPGSPGLDLRDAIRLARKVAGLDPNP